MSSNLARFNCFVLSVVLTLATFVEHGFSNDDSAKKSDQLILVVMDPLAAPLACDCVKGYAQRKYETLGEHLTVRLKRPVKVVWGGALKLATVDVDGRADIIIGKHSVVLHDAALAKMEVEPIAYLTGLDGSTTQTGLIVVRSADRAKTAADLKGYKILFGTPDCDEKSAAVMRLLTKHNIDIPAKPETYDACSIAATTLFEMDEKIDAAAVISSYAQPLLEGCGTIQKGDLRIVAETKPVPFVTAFANKKLDPSLVAEVQKALLAVGESEALLKSLETKNGFVSVKSKSADTTADPATVAKKKN